MDLAREPGNYRAARGLDKTVVRALAKDSAWVRNHENIFVLGPTGVGKSFIASALAQKACRDGYSALYLRAAALLRELALARADGSLRYLLARLGRIDARNIFSVKRPPQAAFRVIPPTANLSAKALAVL